MIDDAVATLVWMLCLAVGIVAVSMAVLIAAIVVAALRKPKTLPYTGHPYHPAYGNLHLVEDDTK
jgi:hypothetical protein